MTILVSGANGQLGNEMRIVSQGSKDRYIFTDVNQASDEQISMLYKLAGEDVDTSTTFLDITDLDAIRRMVSEQGVNAIVNCAAWTDVVGAEDPAKFDLVEKLNATAPENLAIAMGEVNGFLIQISTDYVFGKESYNTPCNEERKGTPTGVYGLAKFHGEQKIMATGCRYVIIRTAWLYSEFGKNFCNTMLKLTAVKPQLKVVFDQVGTPTYALDLAKAIVSILEDYYHYSQPTVHNPIFGIYHFSNEGVCSWYDFTKMIQEYSGQTECNVLPCHSDEFLSPVVRPAYSVLDKTKIKDTFGVKVPYWTDSLKKCICNVIP